ncbi:universal stress protein [Legionella longbeachae]|uniref:Putative universal stress family protein n=1 Tax=Legionella longbeachae serogroup 1 (strain NSW150) TaxID=661367 RepID=D3HQY5_LEGLN|nr:universal stress protein [Legionella longbeachae]VEE01820.1 universal stress family protein [Legionella oakridgensis]HBD7399413.1 universal stress protein [Legionella pneumophila]ARB91861.1 universal stress protein [Legionella longbeachae]ARM34996.1 universal stress protein [Legionella longbeachae]EEZ95591.1 universal stress protein family [Legionella longbeachae D-4968]
MTLSNILIASDFSKHADWAWQRAIDLAKSNQAKIHFLHVVTPPLSSVLPPSETELQPNFLSKKKEIEAKILKKLKDNKLSSVSVVLGRASEEIVRYAGENDCELIIVGAHGRYYINEYVLGTTSGSIIRQSRVPVLLIKKEPDFAYNRIVIATDLTEASKETVQFTFNRFPHASFQLLHIVDVYYRQFFNPTDLDEEFVDTKHPKTKDIFEKLDDFLSQCQVDKSQFERKIMGGYYADCIITQTQKWNADLLAFGTQSKSGLHYLLMGSVAKRILHLSTVDMLAVPPKA